MSALKLSSRMCGHMLESQTCITSKCFFRSSGELAYSQKDPVATAMIILGGCWSVCETTALESIRSCDISGISKTCGAERKISPLQKTTAVSTSV